MIIDEHKTIFIHIPKNAGSSVKTYFKYNSSSNKHRTIKQIKAENPKAYDSYRKFAIVRNPYDRMVSWYFYLKKEMKKEHLKGDWRWKSGEHFTSNFKQWVEDPLKDYYPKWKISNISNSFDDSFEKKDLTKCDVSLLSSQHVWVNDTVYILKYENLNEDLNNFFKEHIDIPIFNNSKHEHYLNYYDKDSLNIVYHRYKQDFDKFNYKKL